MSNCLHLISNWNNFTANVSLSLIFKLNFFYQREEVKLNIIHVQQRCVLYETTRFKYKSWISIVWIRDLGSISPTFYKQLLRTQIPKAQKSCLTWLSFFALLGSACVKAACRMLVKLTLDLFGDDSTCQTQSGISGFQTFRISALA